MRDVLPDRVEALRAGKVPIYEPGLDELLAKNRERLTFTTDVREAIDGADFVYVAVGTPPTYSGDADLSAVWTVIDELPQLDRRVVVALKSTVPVGTGEKVRQRLDARGLQHVGYVSNPEFTAEGTAVRDFLHPDRIVIGAFADADADAVEELHRGIEGPVVRCDVASAEMIKLAANAALMTRISFINEIANVCEATGADVVKVAEGVGLDRRLGPHFLRAGIGYGGSCLAGHESVLVRLAGRAWLTQLDRLFAELAPDQLGDDAAAVRPEGLEVLAWRPGAGAPEFLPVAAATRRSFDGEIVDLRTKMGRRLRCTPDHPLVVATGDGTVLSVKTSAEVTEEDWLPIAQGSAVEPRAPDRLDLLAGLTAASLDAGDVIVRPRREGLVSLGAGGVRRGIEVLEHPRGATARAHDILRSGALRLTEHAALGLTLDGASLGTAKNGTYVPASLAVDETFWRVVGLYIAEGHCAADGQRRRLQWSFHPTKELDLVDEVVRFWRRVGVRADVRLNKTSTSVVVSSRLLAGWWLGVLGLGASCYDQAIPDLAWTAPESQKRALLSGIWRGDGSWSLLNGGPSVALEYGTVSRRLADGLLRLLGDFGVVARLKVGRTSKSTVDTYWLVVSGADQVERLLELVPERDRSVISASIAAQAKRIRPTGYRRHDTGAAWVRITEAVRQPFRGHVYSLEVPGAETFVTTGGLVVHNCFPKDASALKQLAANSGYHFQLLNAVIEVNELQKRRVIGKLQRHLGTLHGKRVALLGLAFKPNTDDMREAPSVVLAGRLLAEGADVTAWDPVADGRSLLHGVELAVSAREALRGADAAVLVTEWPELAELDWAAAAKEMRTALLIDGRNMLDPDAMGAAGFAYEGIGRAAPRNGGLD